MNVLGMEDRYEMKALKPIIQNMGVRTNYQSTQQQSEEYSDTDNTQESVPSYDNIEDVFSHGNVDVKEEDYGVGD